MSASQRRKGAGGEREVCAILQEALGIPVKRLLGQARDGGHDIDLPPFRIEVKRRKRIANLYEWMAQAEFDLIDAKGWSYKKDVSCVALRADGKEWFVVMRLSQWIKLAREEIADANPKPSARLVEETI